MGAAGFLVVEEACLVPFEVPRFERTAGETGALAILCCRFGGGESGGLSPVDVEIRTMESVGRLEEGGFMSSLLDFTAAPARLSVGPHLTGGESSRSRPAYGYLEEEGKEGSVNLLPGFTIGGSWLPEWRRLRADGSVRLASANADWVPKSSKGRLRDGDDSLTLSLRPAAASMPASAPERCFILDFSWAMPTCSLSPLPPLLTSSILRDAAESLFLMICLPPVVSFCAAVVGTPWILALPGVDPAVFVVLCGDLGEH